MNLAGVLPWIHWRGLLILALLVCGNVFCLACPFTLPRHLGPARASPRSHLAARLQSKWPAVVLLVLFLWAYEAFSLWDSPWWTAWIAIGYFLAAFVIDGFFRGAAFCKYVCPIGQFNFVHALMSPLEVKVRDPQACVSCQTKDCLHGRADIPGCEMGLFQPRKTGNLDCTFCLDCVHACPHDNVGILARFPASELWRDAFRSGVGRISRRRDLAAIVLVLVFGAFANAAGMVGPVLEWQDQFRSPLLTTTAFYLCSLLVLPVLTVGVASVVSRRWIPRTIGVGETAVRYSFALVPLGFSAWLAHYSYHFLTSYDTAPPRDAAFRRRSRLLAARRAALVRRLLPCHRLVAALGDSVSRFRIVAIALHRIPHRPERYAAAGTSIKVLAPWAVDGVAISSRRVDFAATDANARHPMKQPILFSLPPCGGGLGWGVAGSHRLSFLLLFAFVFRFPALHADGGAVRFSERRGQHQITVFTAPTPLRSGPVDVSVLIQDAATNEPVADARILVRARPRTHSDDEIRQPATTEAATNKLFQAALFDLPQSGWWDFSIAIEGLGEPMEVCFALETSEPLPRLGETWPWIAWPALAVALFGVHQWLVWRKARRR